MDDRNLVAVAEQAAATAKVVRGAREGATVKFEDGRVFLGCGMEYEDPALNVDAITSAIAAGRIEGARRAVRVGLYSPVAEGLPTIAPGALRRLQEIGVPGLVVIRSSGNGAREECRLSDLLAAAGLAGRSAT